MSDVLDALSALVVKSGVMLGGLPAAQRALALAVAAAALPEDRAQTEPQVNAALRRCLAGECAFLDTDHVELRRWLVDTGWWQRDGFGRAYRRLALHELPTPLQALRAPLDALDLPAWVAAARECARAEREARRQAWATKAGHA